MQARDWFVEWRGRRLGYQQSRILLPNGEPYLDRFILYLLGPCIRLHRFWRGDDIRAPHDHPWDFYTFPFTAYWEQVYFRDRDTWVENLVTAWRWHYRPAEYRHVVLYRELSAGKPFWTLVFAKQMRREWGFWPRWDTFIPWRYWQ